MSDKPNETDTSYPKDSRHASDQWGPRSQFRMFALGEHFDVEAYLETASALREFELIWHIDPPQYMNSGIEVSLGGDRITVKKQEQVAYTYLQTHRRELTDLVNFPGVELLKLGLYYRVELYHGNVFLVTPNSKLMSLALKIGVELSYYVQPVTPSSWPPY